MTEPDRIARRNERTALLTLAALSGGLVAGGVLLFGDLSSSAPAMSVATIPSANALTVTFLLATSFANALVKPTMPALEAE